MTNVFALSAIVGPSDNMGVVLAPAEPAVPLGGLPVAPAVAVMPGGFCSPSRLGAAPLLPQAAVARAQLLAKSQFDVRHAFLVFIVAPLESPVAALRP